MEPGLYTEKGKLKKTWTELESLGIDFTHDFLTNNAGDDVMSSEKFVHPTYVFKKKKLTGNLVIPGDIRIGECAFMNWEGIKEVTFNEGTELISPCVFSYAKIEKVNLPNSLTSIGSFAFEKCLNLKEIRLPENLEKINDYAFYESGLIDIIIPENVNSIGHLAFTDCKDLKNIYILSKTASLAPAGIVEKVFTGNIFGFTDKIFYTEKVPECFKLLTFENLINSGLSFKEANEVMKNIERKDSNTIKENTEQEER